MRLTGLIVVLLLLAGCSRATVGEPEPSSSGPRITATSTPSSSAPASPSPSSPKPVASPAAGAPITDVIAWIEAGRPVEAAGYHSATRDGVTTDLINEVAFTVSAGPRRATKCMTDADSADGALACVVDLVNPPSPPEEIYGQWTGGWVDYGGNTLRVGSAHGDPGRFLHGDGAELPDGSVLSFGDFRCRADRAGLFCVNYAHRSAVRFSPEDIGVFGCLRPVPPPADAGKLYSCAS